MRIESEDGEKIRNYQFIPIIINSGGKKLKLMEQKLLAGAFMKYRFAFSSRGSEASTIIIVEVITREIMSLISSGGF